MRSNKNFKFVRLRCLLLLAVILLLATALRAASAWPNLEANWLYLTSMKFILASKQTMTGEIPFRSEITTFAPQAFWFQGILDLRVDNPTAADDDFTQLLLSRSARISVIHAVRPSAPVLPQIAYACYPDDPAAIAWLADTFVNSDPSRSLILYQQSLASDPQDSRTWQKLGSLALQQQQKDIARQAFQRACDIDSVANGACHSAARLDYNAGDWLGVTHYFSRGSLPEYADDWVLLILASKKLGRTDDANRYLQQAQQRNPADYRKLLNEEP